MMVQKHILWLPSWYPSKVYPHLAPFTQRWALAEAIYDKITVLALVETEEENSLEATVINENMTEVRVFYLKSKYTLIRLSRMMVAGLKGYKYVSRKIGKPDLLHLCVVYPVGLVAIFLSYFHALPLVVSEHWTGYKKEDGNFRGWGMKTLAGLVAHRAKAIVALNDTMAKAMQRCGLKGKYHFVPNVVDVSKIKLPEKRENKVFKFIHVSGLDDRQKYISGLLNGIHLLAKKRKDFIIDIIGGNENIEQFKEKSELLGICNIINFLGPMSHKEVLQKMAEADAFVLFSNFENLPCVILEALALELPVIATETGNMNDWINKTNGLLIEPGDIKALVEAMDYVIVNFEKFDRDLSRNLIQQKCNPKVVGRLFAETHAAVISESKRG